MSDVSKFAGLRVLVVEDEALVAMLVEDMLSDLGCTVVGPVGEIDDALAVVDRENLDCAVLDVNLAGKPIFPVADALKAKGVPFAFASGYGEAGVREDHKSAPVLQKPFREADLARALGRLADARAAS